MELSEYTQVRLFFLQAISLDDVERAQFLAELRETNPTIAKVVEELVEHHESPSSLLDTKPGVVADHGWDLSKGDHVGRFRIVRRLGHGGMGNVYEAEDASLGERVALKTILPELVLDTRIRDRFRFEILNGKRVSHENVCRIHDLVDTPHQPDSPLAFTMELLDGETLSDRLRRLHRFSPKDTRGLAAQIAEGLSALHACRITHRDLKPSNIFIASDDAGFDRVKITDFGLARFHPDGAEAERSVDASRGMPGTPQYMAPEQLRGQRRRIGPATDVYSFGLILYEMTTGQRPFQFSSLADNTVRKLHESPPPPSTLNPEYDRSWDRTILACLAPEPNDRPQNPTSVIQAVEAANEHGFSTNTQSVSKIREVLISRLRPSVALLVAAILVVAVLSFVGSSPDNSSGPQESHRLLARTSEAAVVPFTTLPGIETEPVFAPDGKHIAFVWTGPESANHDIYLKPVDGESAVQLTFDKEWDWSPAFSPDGGTIAFFRRLSSTTHELRTVPTRGGNETLLLTIRAAGVALGLDWSPDGRHLAFTVQPGQETINAIHTFDLETEILRRVTSRSLTSRGEAFPKWSPSGQHIAFVRSDRTDGYSIVLVDENGGTETSYSADTYNGLSWTPDGSAILFPSPAGEFGGEPWLLFPGSGEIRSMGLVGNRGMYPSIDSTGTYIAYSAKRSDKNLWLLDPLGTEFVLPTRPVAIQSSFNEDSPSFSPDGERVAFSSNRSGSYEIWISDLTGTEARRITGFGQGLAGSPSWSPDGSWIAFDHRHQQAAEIYVVATSGGPPRRLTDDPAEDIIPCWSADSRRVYYSSDRGGSYHIWRRPLRGGQPEQVTTGGGFACAEDFSTGDIYFTLAESDTGIWRLDSSTRQEVPVGALSEVGIERYWTIAGDGLYFKPFNGREPESRLNSIIYRLDLRTRAVTEVGIVPGFVYGGPSGLAVSPDETKLLFGQTDYTNSDIMLATGL